MHEDVCNAFLFLSTPSLTTTTTSVAEDKMGWHGKPLPKDMADGVIKDLQSRILNTSKRLYPAIPQEDTPPVSLRNIRMPSGPSYKSGEKVKAVGSEIKHGRRLRRNHNPLHPVSGEIEHIHTQHRHEDAY